MQWKPGTWDATTSMLTFAVNDPRPDDDSAVLRVRMKFVGATSNELKFIGTSFYDELYVKQLVHLGLPSGSDYTLTKDISQR